MECNNFNTHEIFELNHCTPEILDGVRRLLTQLSPEPVELSAETLQLIVDSADTYLFLLRAEGRVAGMCTVAFYRSPTGLKAWIEDVVVDEAFRGRGFGRMLVRHAIDFAARQGGCKLMLTSRPSRTAANRMYASMGFVRRDTNVYMMQLPQQTEE